jgi:hypothetical protein
MKRALLLLALVCLLIAAPVSAAAYEPTNGIALDANIQAIKTMAKEEVSSAFVAVENVALPAVPIPADDLGVTTLKSDCTYAEFGKTKSLWRVDRGNSRFT